MVPTGTMSNPFSLSASSGFQTPSTTSLHNSLASGLLMPQLQNMANNGNNNGQPITQFIQVKRSAHRHSHMLSGRSNCSADRSL